MRQALLISTVLALALSSMALGQQPPSDVPGVFGEVLDVRVINLEVVVTDKKGTPITGLNASDFTLLVDDEEVTIEYFTEVRGGAAIDAEVLSDGSPVAGIPSIAPGEPVGTSYLVFVDDFFSLPTDRNKVLQSLADDVVALQPEDRMAVVAYDGKRPEMLSTWSQDYVALQRVFRDAMERPAYGLHRLAERRQFETELGRSLDQLVNYGEDERTDAVDGRPIFSRRRRVSTQTSIPYNQSPRGLCREA